MRMFSFAVAGGGGRRVHVNPEQVVRLVDQGDERTQIVTAGLSGSSSMPPSAPAGDTLRPAPAILS